MKRLIALALLAATLNGCVSLVTMDNGKEYYRVESPVPVEALLPTTSADIFTSTILLLAVLMGVDPTCHSEDTIGEARCTKERENAIRRCKKFPGSAGCEVVQRYLLKS